MSILSSIFLGLVQGVAEFLPISSSGHLSLFQHFFGMASADGNLFFDVLLHLGTLIAIFVYYRKDILGLLKELVHLIQCVFSSQKRKEMKRLPPDGRMILMIIIATLPLFVILPIKSKKTAKSATMLDALLVGVGQAIAVVPGLSRSGTTISAGLVRGFSRKFAVRFSFLMSIPAVLGANILSIAEAVQEGIDTSLLPAYLIGTAVAAVSGYFAIGLVNLLTNKGKFGNFAYYCWGIGAAAVVASLIFHG